jgi:hypothetical protein
MADAVIARDARTNIALKLCRCFVDLDKAVSRRDLLLEFGSRDLLDQMGARGLLREDPNSRDCLPSVGSFALLADEHELYLRARDAFAQMIFVLGKFYRLDYGYEEYQSEALWKSLDDFLGPGEKVQRDVFDLARSLFSRAVRYLRDMETQCQADKDRKLQARGVGAIHARSDALVGRARPQFSGAAECGCTALGESRSLRGPDFPQVVWSLLNPAIVKEAMPRFAAGHYADAVEASLKVVCREIRAKTG